MATKVPAPASPHGMPLLLPDAGSSSAALLYSSAIFLNIGYCVVLLVHVVSLPPLERRRPTMWAVPLLSLMAQLVQVPYMQDKPIALGKIAAIGSLQLASVLVCLLGGRGEGGGGGGAPSAQDSK